MSEAETTTSSSSRKRSSARSSSSPASSESAGKIVETYEDALEAGYIGGPIDEDDHTVTGEVASAEKAEASE